MSTDSLPSTLAIIHLPLKSRCFLGCTSRCLCMQKRIIRLSLITSKIAFLTLVRNRPMLCWAVIKRLNETQSLMAVAIIWLSCEPFDRHSLALWMLRKQLQSFVANLCQKRSNQSRITDLRVSSEDSIPVFSVAPTPKVVSSRFQP